MKIVIVGAGAVGFAVCSQLIAEGHDITVVDTRTDPLTELSNIYDVIGVQGNGADVSVLRKAVAEKADIVLAVTPHDEINILCCAVASKLGARSTIARVENPDYVDTLQLLKQDFNLSMTINPDLAAAKVIYRQLCYSSAAKVETFFRGRVELVEFNITSDSPFAGKSLFDLRAGLKLNFLVCGVLRGEKMHIPSGDFVIKPGDLIGMTASHEDLNRLFKAAGTLKQPIRDILVVGGGAITYHLEKLLQKTRVHSTVIEPDKALCYELTDKFDCTVVCDNGSKQEVLLEEGIERTDAFLALTPSEEHNAIMSMYARSMGVDKVITLVHQPSYVDFFRGMELESIVTPKTITATEILHYVRALTDDSDSEIESLHKIMGNHAEAIEFVIKEDIPKITDIPLKDLKPKSGVLVACVVHNNKIIIPTGETAIRKGDTVIVITSTDEQLTNIKDIIK